MHDPPAADFERSTPKVRTHLANERTFLAWVRTGLTLIALGVAGAQILEDHRLGSVSLTKVLAGAMVALGAWLVVIGRWRFRQAAIGIRDGTFRTRRRAFEPIVIGIVVIAILALIVIVRMPGR